ncbi:MAG: hypothetical protein JWQ11_3126, partial [Rhizobacter sp.]|nr:hypothetical protein [Rhizobacter sp.]
MPHEADFGKALAASLRDLTTAQRQLLALYIDAAPPDATDQKRKLDDALERRRRITALKSPSAPSRSAPQALIETLWRGDMPRLENYCDAYSAADLELAPDQRRVLNAYINGAAAHATPFERCEMLAELDMRQFASGFEDPRVTPSMAAAAAQELKKVTAAVAAFHQLLSKPP